MKPSFIAKNRQGEKGKRRKGEKEKRRISYALKTIPSAPLLLCRTRGSCENALHYPE